MHRRPLSSRHLQYPDLPIDGVVGGGAREGRQVHGFMVDRLGLQYDMRNILDL